MADDARPEEAGPTATAPFADFPVSLSSRFPALRSPPVRAGRWLAIAGGCAAFGWTLVAIPVGIWAMGMAMAELSGGMRANVSPMRAGLVGWLALLPLAGALAIGGGLSSTIGNDFPEQL